MVEDLSSTVHRLFVLLYALTITMSIMVSVSSGVVTDYWADGIGGCILYASVREPVGNNATDWTMHGSAISNCHYITFTPVFMIFIGLLAIVFHLRSLFCQRCWRAEEGKSDFWDVIVRILVVLAAFMTFLSLVVACMITHGHDVTCYELRSYVGEQGLSPWMGISEAQVHELFSRLDCGFFYAALDFGLNIGSNQGRSMIDSHAALEVAIATAWFQFFFWLSLTGANAWLAHRLKVDLVVPLPAMPAVTAVFDK